MKFFAYLILLTLPLGLHAQTKTEIFKELNSIFQKAKGIEYKYENSLGEEDKSIVGKQLFSENEISVSWTNDKKVHIITCESPNWKQVGDVSVSKLKDNLGVLRLTLGKGSKRKYTIDGKNEEFTSLELSFYFRLGDKEKVEKLVDKLGREIYGDEFDE